MEDKLASKQDMMELKANVATKLDLLQLKHDLTLKLGAMLSAAVALVAAIMTVLHKFS